MKTAEKRNDDKRQKGKTDSLISKNFFNGHIEIDESKVFPMVVIATMSSGKSTLINALLGKQILPSKNMACTAKVYSILDEDQESDPRLYITYKNGNTIVKDETIEEELEKANEDNAVSQIFIKGHVKGVLNTDRALLIVDTPGPNNSMDVSHERIMKGVLNKIRGGLILYVLNATQLGICDDQYLLNVLDIYLRKKKRVKILFVINKIDQIDVERESIEKIVLDARGYLVDIGFENPSIIPVSALAASVFKKVLNQESLTRKEYAVFQDCYELFGPKGYNMKSYAMTDELSNPFEMVTLKGSQYKTADLILAVENTGIKLLEDMVQKEQILSSGK